MPEYSPLPSEVQEICRAVHAPPRLVAHLILVHDLAEKLIREVGRRWPAINFDKAHVLFGAATHDVGKAICPEELIAPGHKHEQKGADLLQQHGVHKSMARFSFTHANWKDKATIEDLLVALADNLWKGKRLAELEDRLVKEITERTGREPWEIFGDVDQLCTVLTADADQRLAWQASFPAHG